MVEYGPYKDINGDKWVKCALTLITFSAFRRTYLLEHTKLYFPHLQTIIFLPYTLYFLFILSLFTLHFIYNSSVAFIFSQKIPKGVGDKGKGKRMRHDDDGNYGQG